LRLMLRRSRLRTWDGMQHPGRIRGLLSAMSPRTSLTLRLLMVGAKYIAVLVLSIDGGSLLLAAEVTHTVLMVRGRLRKLPKRAMTVKTIRWDRRWLVILRLRSQACG
jgi:hypothetical protein